MTHSFKIITLFFALFIIHGCTTVRVPNLDFFDKNKSDLGKYPKLSDLPDLPEDLRPVKQWDNQVKKIIKDRKNVSDDIKTISKEETSTVDILDEIITLKTIVKSYKNDDPVDSNSRNE